MQTVFGGAMDTVADKVLALVLYLFLILEEPIFILIFLCECVIAIMNTCANILGWQTRSSKVGKMKMWFVAVNIIVGYLYYFEIAPYGFAVLTTILTFVIEMETIVNYAISLTKKAPKKKNKHKIENINDLVYVLFNTDYYLSTL